MSLETTAPVLPAHCANCAETAAHAKKEEYRGRTLMVPYCTRCFHTVERDGTWRFAGALASVMIAITLLLTLPLLWVSASAVTYTLASVVSALLPLGLVLVLRFEPLPGQSAGGRAAWWGRGSRLYCTSKAWATALSNLNSAKLDATRAFEPSPRGLISGPLLALLVAPFLYSLQHPKLVVLNLGDEPFSFLVDGRTLSTVEVTSLESAASGVHLRLSAGRHRVSLVATDGALLHEEELALSAGRTHLYAPLSTAHCFWLERDAYGKVKEPPFRYRSLPDDRRFWTLPVDVDNWFAKNPQAASDERSSGGTLTAVRHARCDQLPPELK